MKSLWERYKMIFYRNLIAVVFLIAFIGIGISAYQRIQVAGAETGSTAGNTQSGNYQKAAASTSGAITAYIDWENQDLKIVSTLKDDYFYISDSKMKTWDEVDAEQGVAYCDLSWITKEYELNIKGDKGSDLITINIQAPRTLKAKFSMVNEEPKITLTVTETVDKKKETTEIDPSKGDYSVQWRKGTTGAWNSYSTLDLQSFFTKGATLNLRLAGECNTDASKCYLPSKVASVKVTKKASAPSTKIDASKFVLGVKKGEEYVVITDTTTGSIYCVSDASFAKPNLQDIAGGALGGDGYNTPMKAFTVKVRTSSTDKKSASKWTVISYPAQRTVSDNDLTVKLDTSGKVSKVTLTNNTTYDIEYLIGETALVQTIKQAEISSKTKWSTVKAQKAATAKLSKTTTVTSSSAIFFRYAQEKDNTKTTENEAQLASTVGIVHPS